MVGQKLRDVRNARGLSMREVSKRAHISLASLSRIETNQQGLEIGLFLHLAKILDVDPSDLLPEEGEAANGHEPIVRRIGTLNGRDRLAMWRKLTLETRTARKRRRAATTQLAEEVEELLAHVEFLHAEIESVRSRLRGSREPSGNRRDEADAELQTTV